MSETRVYKKRGRWNFELSITEVVKCYCDKGAHAL